MKIKGMVVYDGRTWTAMSFGLAAQAFSTQEVLAKLTAQIEDSIKEAQGQDTAFQVQLYSRFRTIQYLFGYEK